VRDLDAGFGVELDVFYEVVGVGLLPVARFAVCAGDLGWLLGGYCYRYWGFGK
jgi:hypothetical protein